ncbi:MAG: glycosyltransferase [Planctomycetales bacterium]
MRLIFLHASPFPAYTGGIETWLYHVTTHLSPRFPDLEICFIVPDSDQPPGFDLTPFSNVRFVKLRPWSLPNAVRFNGILRPVGKLMTLSLAVLRYLWWSWTGYRALRRCSPKDTLFVLHTIPAMLPVVLGRCLGVRFARVFCSVRGRVGDDLEHFGYRGLSRLYLMLERFCLKFVDVILANGPDTLNYVRNKLGLDGVVLANGVDVERFRHPQLSLSSNPEWQQLSDLKRQGVKLLVNVGTLRDIKGIPELIKAAAELRKLTETPFRLVLVGKGDAKHYQRQADALGVGEFVIFTGHQSQVPEFLALGDVVLGVSGGGGYGHALLEMMVAGRPVVAWDSEIYAQLIEHQKSGYLVKAGDSAALAAGIHDVLSHPELAAAMGAAAVEVGGEFDWENIIQKFSEIVLQSPQSPKDAKLTAPEFRSPFGAGSLLYVNIAIIIRGQEANTTGRRAAS